jgi:4'-phosphopantetheinyl transferase
MRSDQVADSIWQVPDGRVELPLDEVHVWRASLDQPQRLESFFALLAADEKARAARFYFQRDREHYTVARGLLRTLLSRYLNVRPSGLTFSYGPQGKPFLADGSGGDLRFNISHSHGLALLAFTRGRELGIDLERIRADAAGEQIAERFFSASEVAVLRQLPASQQTDAFFNCWARKEAFIKARGEGLSLPLDQFCVSLVPGEPAVLLSAEISAHEAERWAMAEIVAGVEFKAALAVEGRDWRLRCWQWPE